MSGIAYFNPNLAQDANGNPSGLANAYFYDTGTTTPQTVYEDAGLTIAHPQPLVSDASGNFASVFSAGVTDLKVDVKDSAGATLPGYPIDPAILQSSGSAASSVSFLPTARITSDTAQAAIEEVDASVKAIEDADAQDATIYTTAGTTTAYTLAVSGVTAYAANERYWVRCNATNTAACTISVQSAGAKSIKKYDGAGVLQDLAKNEFNIGSEYLLHYDGTQFVIISSREAYPTMETGTWTPVNSGIYAGPTIGASPTYSGTWTRVGDIVTVDFRINYDDAATAISANDRALVGGLPFQPLNGAFIGAGAGIFGTNPGGGVVAICNCSAVTPNYLYWHVSNAIGAEDYGTDLKGTITYKAYIP